MANPNHQKIYLIGLLAAVGLEVAAWCIVGNATKRAPKGEPPPQVGVPSSTLQTPLIGAFPPTHQAKLVPVLDEHGNLKHYKDSTEGVYSSATGFRFPFLKTVTLPARSETVSIKMEATDKQFPVKVYRDAEEGFVRAEFAQKGEFIWEELPENTESLYEMHAEVLKPLPAHRQKLSLQQIITKLDEHIPLADATQWAITAVQMDSLKGFPPDEFTVTDNVYIAHVYGVMTAGGRIPDEPHFRKVRVVLDLNGDVLQWDNRL